MIKEYINKDYFDENLNQNIKLIEGYGNRYFIDRCGEVYSKYRNGKILKLQKRINQGGYYYVNLCVKSKYKSISVHRLIGKYFVNNPNNLDVLNHIDCNKLNNNVNNLEFVTFKYNIKHAVENGLLKPNKGEKCNLSKLTELEVLEIRQLMGKLNQREIAQRYKINRSTVSQIHNRVIWKHI